jgi:monolysocardiolipin acyltransferase
MVRTVCWDEQGVLTVCNHVSAVDDPGAVAAMLPLTWFFTPEVLRVSEPNNSFLCTSDTRFACFPSPQKVRWTICATDRCFKNGFTSSVLSHGRVGYWTCRSSWVRELTGLSSLQVLPIERGKGVYQPMMDDVIAKLSQGDWVHMFPEGTRSRSSTATLQSIKLGVGRYAGVRATVLDAQHCVVWQKGHGPQCVSTGCTICP